jgi:regulatory protein
MDTSNFPQKLYDQLLRYLATRPRSEAELREYCQRKKALPHDIEIVFPLLKELNLLNDYEFAVWWVDQRNTFRPKGKNLLKLELTKKGVNRDIIQKVLEETTTNESEWEKAYMITAKRGRTLRRFEKDEVKEKLTAFLSRRGFSFEVIRSVVDEFLKKEYNTP